MLKKLRDVIWKDITAFMNKREIVMSDRMQVLSLRKQPPNKKEMAKSEAALDMNLHKVRIQDEIIQSKFSKMAMDYEAEVLIAREMAALVT